MNLDKFEERWRLGHPFDKFVPPFIGGPIDELFMRGAPSQNLTATLPRLVVSMGNPAVAAQSPSTAAPKLRPSVNRNGNMSTRIWLQPRIPIGRGNGDRLAGLIGMWVRVGNIPSYLFHLIYYFFNNLGTLASMRAYNDDTFYLLYKYPKDTLRALSYHRKRVIFLDQVVCFTCTVVRPSAMEMINNNQTVGDVNHAELIDLSEDEYNCNEFFIYDDEYEEEFDGEFNTDAPGLNKSCSGAGAGAGADADAGATESDDEKDDDQYYALSETAFVEMSEFWNSVKIHTPNESLLKYCLCGIWEWFRVNMDSLIEYVKCDVLK